MTADTAVTLMLEHEIMPNPLGHYPSEEEAALAYNEAALKYRGEYARLNLIESREK